MRDEVPVARASRGAASRATSSRTRIAAPPARDWRASGREARVAGEVARAKLAFDPRGATPGGPRAPKFARTRAKNGVRSRAMRLNTSPLLVVFAVSGISAG